MIIYQIFMIAGTQFTSETSFKRALLDNEKTFWIMSNIVGSSNYCIEISLYAKILER